MQAQKPMLVVSHSRGIEVEVKPLRRHGRLARRPLALRLLDPLRNLLRGQPRCRIVAELLDQAGNRREHAGLLLVIHQPLHKLRVNSLTLRRSREDRPRSLHALDKRLVHLAIPELPVAVVQAT